MHVHLLKLLYNTFTFTVFGSWSLGCSRLLLAAPAVRLLGLLLAASLLLACCWLLVADGCCCSSREQPIRQLPNTVDIERERWWSCLGPYACAVPCVARVVLRSGGGEEEGTLASDGPAVPVDGEEGPGCLSRLVAGWLAAMVLLARPRPSRAASPPVVPNFTFPWVWLPPSSSSAPP